MASVRSKIKHLHFYIKNIINILVDIYFDQGLNFWKNDTIVKYVILFS